MPSPTSLRLKVARTTLLTPRIRQLELVAENGAALPAFSAGGHIDIEVGPDDFRSYSLLNDPAEIHRYVVAVLLEPASKGGSAFMHGQVTEGDILTAQGPSNDFPLNEMADDTILIAGGIGITPMLSMVERLLHLDRRFTLHYCTRQRDDAPFAAELERRLGERLVLHHDNGDPAQGLDVATLLARRPPGGHVYVCGPHGMIQAVRTAGRDWPKGTVHFELFSGSAEDTEPRSTDLPFDIELAKTGGTLTVPVGSTILEVLRANGVRVKSMCTTGVCGTCRVGYLAGDVDHRDEALTKKEQLKFVQVCVSRAMPGSRLVLNI
jgi:vanillate O-demethylase ferredoxin subunit